MATHLDLHYKLLERYLKEIVFIEIKPDRQLDFGGLNWPSEVPLPVYVPALAEQIRENNIEEIPLVAILKGIVYYLGASPDAGYSESYLALLRRIDAEFYMGVIQDGLRHADDGRFLDAILYLSAANRLNARSAEISFFLGRCYLDFAKTVGAASSQSTYEKIGRIFMETCLKIDASFADASFHLGFAYYNEGRYLEAQEQWTQALSGNLTEDARDEAIRGLSRVRDRAEFERGRALILSNRLDEGIEILKALESEHDDWWELLFFIGVGLRMQSLFEDALGYFLKVLSLNTGHIQTMNELGICLMSMGDYKGAEKYYKEALRLAPKNAELLCNMGIVYLNQGDLEAARRYFGDAHELAPEDEVVQMWIDHMNAGLS